MWRNEVVRDFVEWLHELNRGRDPSVQAGFYSLDVYSLYRSSDAVLDYLAAVDPDAVAVARARYGCLDHVGAQRTIERSVPVRPDCEEEVVEQLLALRAAGERYVCAGMLNGDAHFAALQNARVVRSAEAYYRQMLRADVSTGNMRDQPMLETLASLKEHLSGDGRPARIVVWAHNSHVGDARATKWREEGEQPLGQLVREWFGERSRLIGFTTHRGTVTAASQWDGPPGPSGQL